MCCGMSCSAWLFSVWSWSARYVAAFGVQPCLRALVSQSVFPPSREHPGHCGPPHGHPQLGPKPSDHPAERNRRAYVFGMASASATHSDMGIALAAVQEQVDFDGVSTDDVMMESTAASTDAGSTAGEGASQPAQRKAKAKGHKSKQKEPVAKFCKQCETETEDWSGNKPQCRICTNDVEAAERDSKKQGEYEWFKELRRNHKDKFVIFIREWRAKCGPARGPGFERGGFQIARYRQTFQNTIGNETEFVRTYVTRKEFLDRMYSKGQSREWAIKEWDTRCSSGGAARTLACWGTKRTMITNRKSAQRAFSDSTCVGVAIQPTRYVFVLQCVAAKATPEAGALSATTLSLGLLPGRPDSSQHSDCRVTHALV